MAIKKLSLRLEGLYEPENGVLVGDGALYGDGIVMGDAAAMSEADPILEFPPFRLQDLAGLTTWRDKPIFNHEQVIGQFDIGTTQPVSNDKITFSFLTGNPTGWYNSASEKADESNEAAGFSEFTDAQKAAARDSMVLWDDLIAPSIVEKVGKGADILLANTTTGPAQAGAYLPGNGEKRQGDIWTADPDVNWSNGWLQYDSYGRTTLIHEAGHSLGLPHPGDYNFSDDKNGDGVPDPITYVGDAFYAQDSKQYTIMSYFGAWETGGQMINPVLRQLANAQTPLLDDILAIQHLYGADPTTRTGDTVYFSNSNAGNPVYDLAANPFPHLAVYDAGGEDTFDFSDANRSVFIDLRPGGFSSAAKGAVTLEQANAMVAEYNEATSAAKGDLPLFTSQAQVDAEANYAGSLGHNRVLNDTGVAGIFATSHRNVSIAYNTTIENANGGSARDYLYGNDVSNKLNGNGGNDVLDGAKGDDILTGGTGNDQFRVTEIGFADEIVDFTSGFDKIFLGEIDANSGVAGNQAFTFIGSNAFSGVAGQLRTYSQDGDNYVAGDVNGDGVADFTINVNSANVVVTDFFL